MHEDPFDQCAWGASLPPHVQETYSRKEGLTQVYSWTTTDWSPAASLFSRGVTSAVLKMSGKTPCWRLAPKRSSITGRWASTVSFRRLGGQESSPQVLPLAALKSRFSSWMSGGGSWRRTLSADTGLSVTDGWTRRSCDLSSTFLRIVSTFSLKNTANLFANSADGSDAWQTCAVLLSQVIQHSKMSLGLGCRNEISSARSRPSLLRLWQPPKFCTRLMLQVFPGTGGSRTQDTKLSQLFNIQQTHSYGRIHIQLLCWFAGSACCLRTRKYTGWPTVPLAFYTSNVREWTCRVGSRKLTGHRTPEFMDKRSLQITWPMSDLEGASKERTTKEF